MKPITRRDFIERGIVLLAMFPTPYRKSVNANENIRRPAEFRHAASIGQTMFIAEIMANEYWNSTNIFLEKGRRYRSEASGVWFDDKHPCNADGWDPPWSSFWLRLSDRIKRQPGERLFTLMGAINRKPPYLVLGTKSVFEATASGELFCFANDVPGFYWNNSGAIRLSLRLTE